jgi:hypothetical protein
VERLNDLAVYALSVHLAAYPVDDENVKVMRRDAAGLIIGPATGVVFRSGPLPITRAIGTNYAIRAERRPIAPTPGGMTCGTTTRACCSPRA